MNHFSASIEQKCAVLVVGVNQGVTVMVHGRVIHDGSYGLNLADHGVRYVQCQQACKNNLSKFVQRLHVHDFILVRSTLAMGCKIA